MWSARDIRIRILTIQIRRRRFQLRNNNSSNVSTLIRFHMVMGTSTHTDMHHQG